MLVWPFGGMRERRVEIRLGDPQFPYFRVESRSLGGPPILSKVIKQISCKLDLRRNTSLLPGQVLPTGLAAAYPAGPGPATPA